MIERFGMQIGSRGRTATAEHELIHLVHGHEIDLDRLENGLEQMGLVGEDVVEEFAFVKERLVRVAFETVETNEKRASIKMLMKRVLERELVRACNAWETHRYRLFLM